MRRRLGSVASRGINWFCDIESEIQSPGDRLRLRALSLRLRRVSFGEPMWIGSGFKLFSNGKLWKDATKFKFGRRCSFGEDTTICVFEEIRIGDDFLTAGQLYLNSGSHEVETLWPKSAPISIGDRVWVGARSTILSGAEIGDDVVIGSGSTVRGVIPSNCFAAGSPARPIRSIRKGPTAMWSWVKSDG